MKKSIVLFMVATMLVTTVFFTQNVMADGLVDGINSDIETPFESYIVVKVNGHYRVYTNFKVFDKNNNIVLSGETQMCEYEGIEYDYDGMVEFLKSGKHCKSYAFESMVVDYIVASSHGYVWNGKVFQQSPLRISNQGPTVGKMKAEEIVQAILTQKIFLIPLLITLVVVLVGFRKALRTLFQVLKRA